MKKTLIVTLMMVAGIAQAGQSDCTKGAGMLVDMVQNMYATGNSRNEIERSITQMGGAQMGQMAARIASVLYNAPKGGWTDNELSKQKAAFVRGACN